MNVASTGEPRLDHLRQERRSSVLPPVAIGVLIGLCTAKLLLHLFTSDARHYGYFRDELYYLDMARHLDWGYVDAAPLIALYAKIALWMGGSLAALRILPALAGTALVALTILIARELGGGWYAQFLAPIAILLCPAVLMTDSLLTMNAFEPLFWMGCIWVVARILRTGDSRLWLWFGVLAGLGLENKHSTLSFGFAVTFALLLTHHRREFARPWIWIAGAIALTLFLPNIIWQVRHHFPTIEDLANVRREGKNVVLAPLAFVKEQIIDMHPILLPVWLSGLVWFFRDWRWRLLGLIFLTHRSGAKPSSAGDGDGGDSLRAAGEQIHPIADRRCVVLALTPSPSLLSGTRRRSVRLAEIGKIRAHQPHIGCHPIAERRVRDQRLCPRSEPWRDRNKEANATPDQRCCVTSREGEVHRKGEVHRRC